MTGAVIYGIVPCVRVSEWIALCYFLYLAAVSWTVAIPPLRRAFVIVMAAISAGFVFALACTAPAIARDWAPLLYIAGGYYAAGLLFVSPSEAVEKRLLDWDRRWIGDPTTRFARWPRTVLGY